MKLKASPNARASLDRVIARFQEGDISPIVAVAQIKLPADAPAAKWSWSNRILAFAQGGHADCRGYVQWQEAGRYVRKRDKEAGEGPLAVWITIPFTHKETDEETGEEHSVLHGFGTAPVYPYTVTLPMEDAEDVLIYEPQELPPLADLAEALGIEMTWSPARGRERGSAKADGSAVTLSSTDLEPWFHELGHAIHSRIKGGLEGGQDPHQETVAELVAVVLMELYGVEDRTGNAWQYIASYNADPLTAIAKAVDEVGEVLDFITEELA